MDRVFLDRLHAKVRQHLNLRVQPCERYGLAPYVKVYLDQNGKLVSVCLALIQRYWERSKPDDARAEAAAHEKLLLHLLTEDRKTLEDAIKSFLQAFPQYANSDVKSEIETHFEVWETKVRDEIAILQSTREHEVSDQRRQWILGAAVPILCAVLSVYFAGDSRATLKELQIIRKEMAELAKSSLVASSLILDGSERISAPTHKLAALKRMREVEDRIRQFYPGISDEISQVLRQANADEDKFWKRYEALPEANRDKFMKDYLAGKK